MSDILWEMQCLRYASPSNGPTYRVIKPQTPDGYIRSQKQPSRITRKTANSSSRKRHSCHSCFSSLQRIFNNLAQKCSFICSQMAQVIGLRSDYRRACENGTPSQIQLPHTTIVGRISHRVPYHQFCPTARGTTSTNPEGQFPQLYDNIEQIVGQVAVTEQDDFPSHSSWRFCVRFSRCAL